MTVDCGRTCAHFVLEDRCARPVHGGHVEFDDVRFSYPTATDAVARLALITPGRTDLVNAAAAGVERTRALRLADRPPSETTLMLLERAERVTLGRVKLISPGGVSVKQVTVSWHDGRPPHHVLRLRRHGQHVGDYRSVDELARHVDLSTLVEELPQPAER